MKYEYEVSALCTEYPFAVARGGCGKAGFRFAPGRIHLSAEPGLGWVVGDPLTPAAASLPRCRPDGGPDEVGSTGPAMPWASTTRPATAG